MYNFIRAAAAAPALRPADCAFNAEEMVKVAAEAQSKGVRILVFPKLSITGASCGDLIFQSSLFTGALEALKFILKKTAGLEMLITVGLPLRYASQVLNCSAVIFNGEIMGVIPEREVDGSVITLFGRETPFGTDILLTCAGIPEALISVVGSDAIYRRGFQNGSSILLCPAAVHETVGASKMRRERLAAFSGADAAACIYASAGPGESVSDGVYGGHLLICENGALLAERKPFDGKNNLIIADIDAELLANVRARNGLKAYKAEGCSRKIVIPIENVLNETLERKVSRNPFFPEEPEEFAAACDEIFDIQKTALARRIAHAKAKTAVVNVSGGADSTLALLALCGAADMSGAGRQSITALTLPGFGTTGGTYRSAQALMHGLGVHIREIDIKEACNAHFKEIGLSADSRSVTFENAQARERTQIAMDIANMENGIMIGTGNMSEAALGFTTYGGDHLSMYNPNAGLTKTAVRAVIKRLADTRAFGGEISDVLYNILSAPVSPELLPPGASGEIVQKTEDTVGPYELHDFFLYNMLYNGFAPGKIAYLAVIAFENDYSAAEIKRWLELFVKRFFTNQYKRSCSPEGPRAFDVSLSPRGGFIMPGDAGYVWWV